jgi:glutamate synthase domain-containing protein 3
VREPADRTLLRGLIERHAELTGSAKAQRVLAQWDQLLPKFVRVMAVEYKKVLEQRRAKKAATREAVHG